MADGADQLVGINGGAWKARCILVTFPISPPITPRERFGSPLTEAWTTWGKSGGEGRFSIDPGAAR